METKGRTEFIPFHALNEFMRNDFRIQVIRKVLVALPDLDKGIRNRINRLTKKHIKVAGFRNSVKAPATVKAVAMTKAFEKHPDLVGAIIEGWSHTQPDLRQNMYKLLLSRGWKLLPLEVNRNVLPGFLTRWPEGEDYDALYEALEKTHPDNDNSIDETSLMAVYLSARLPISKVEMDLCNEFDSFKLPEDKNENDNS